MADNEDNLASEVADEQEKGEEEEPVAEDEEPAQAVVEEKAVENEIETEAQVPETEEEQAPEQEPETRDDAEEKQNEEEQIEPEENPAGEQVEERKPENDDEILPSDFEFERVKTENELSEAEDGEQPEIDDKRDEGEEVKEDEQEVKGVTWEEEEGIKEVDQLAEDEPAPDDVSVIESDLPEEAEPLDLSFQEAEELDIPAPDVSNLEPTSPEILKEENRESKGDIRRVSHRSSWERSSGERSSGERSSGDRSVVDADHPKSLRAQLFDKYEEAIAARDLLKLRNAYLQNKLADYFRKNKTDEASDGDKSIADHEQRYLKYMAQLEEVKAKYAAKEDSYKSQIEDIKTRSQHRKDLADKERIRFTEFKKGVGLKAIFAYNGKPVVAKDIEQYLSNELKKEEEVRNNRLENIKLKHKLKKKEHELKTKEELVEGLHLIDFEQLKIENQTYNEKIEERNEELLKLRKKVTGTVQILTHVKEKLQFLQARNLVQSTEVKEVEALVGQKRDILSRTKQARDALRIDNNKLRQKCGFLGNPSLLMDFENQKFEGSHLQSRLDELKMTHADLTVSCQHTQKKIEQGRNSLL